MTSWDALRLMCGAFFIPHALDKLFRPVGPAGFFAAAGLPNGLWVLRAAAAVEISCGVAMMADFHVREAAVVALVYLVAAAIAVAKVSKGRWLWNLGGFEYCVFWGLGCLTVALGH